MSWIDTLSQEDQDDLLRAGHAGMLYDSYRHSAYQKAISAAVSDVHASDQTVYMLDIGAGTGLLTIFAAQAGAEKIVACESFGPMAVLANKVIQRNRSSFSESEITIEHCSSTDLDSKYYQQFNIIVSEIYDSELVGEGCLVTYKHALNHLAAPGCIFIPQQATIYAQPMFSESLLQYQTLSNSVYLEVPEVHKTCPGFVIPWEVHVDKLSDVTCGENFEVWEFEFGLKGSEKWLGQKIIKSEYPHCVGFILWWRSELYKNNFICTAPSGHKWFEESRDHWMPQIHFIPKQSKSFTFFATLYSLSLSGFDNCTCDLHIASLPHQFGSMNCERLRHLYISQFNKWSNNARYVGGRSLLPIMMAKHSGKVVKVDKGFFEDRFMTILAEHNCVTKLLLENETDECGVVIIDRYDGTCLTNLAFYEKWLSRNVTCPTIPSNVHLVMFAIESEEISKKVFPPRSIPSINHPDIDLREYHSVVLELHSTLSFEDRLDPIFLWEFEHKMMSEKVIIQDVEAVKRGKVEIPILSSGKVHAVCFALVLEFEGETFEGENEWFTKTDVLCLSDAADVKKGEWFNYK